MSNHTTFRLRHIHEQLDKFITAHTIIEETLARRAEKLQDWVEEQRYVLSEDEWEDEWEEFEKSADLEIAETVEELPYIMRSSLFVAIYGLFEHELVSLCKDYEKANVRIFISDLRGDGIERARLYLKKVINIAFPDQGPEWQAIKNYNLLRNIAIHNQGNLNGNPKASHIEGASTSIRGLTITSSQRIELNGEFNVRFIDNLKLFVDNLFAVLQT